jgi:hypothetical protein
VLVLCDAVPVLWDAPLVLYDNVPKLRNAVKERIVLCILPFVVQKSLAVQGAIR